MTENPKNVCFLEMTLFFADQLLLCFTATS